MRGLPQGQRPALRLPAEPALEPALAAPRSHSPFPQYPEALLIFTSAPFIVSDRQGWLPGDRGYFKQQAPAHGAVSRALSHCTGQLVCTQWSEGAEAKKTSCGLGEMKER